MDDRTVVDGISGPTGGATGSDRVHEQVGEGGLRLPPGTDLPDDPAVVGSAYDDMDSDGLAHDPLRFSNWMKRSATGTVLSGIALGLHQALEQKRNVPACVVEAPDRPEDPDAPFILHFDPDDPTKCVAVMRTPIPGTQSSD